LDLVVAFVGDRPELHFLDFDLLALLLRLVGLLLLLEAELAEVHYLADLRDGSGLDLEHGYPGILSVLHRDFVCGHASHFAVRANHAHARDANVLVAAVLLVVDADTWISKGTRAGHRCGRACLHTATWPCTGYNATRRRNRPRPGARQSLRRTSCPDLPLTACARRRPRSPSRGPPPRAGTARAAAYARESYSRFSRSANPPRPGSLDLQGFSGPPRPSRPGRR